MDTNKSLYKMTLDELQELAEVYAQKYEPRFRNCARQAYTEGLLEALASLSRSES